ncbi:MAG: hypothetical protein EBS29_11180 [Chloroflexia bacterium]|nr:hypothetical protein [Chloroflexia bacterium]
MYSFPPWIFSLKTVRHRPYIYSQALLLGWCLLLLSNCGQPIQPLNRTPRASGTRLVATNSTPVTPVVTPSIDAGDSATQVATDVVSPTLNPAGTSIPTPAISIVITPQLRATPTGDERWAAFVSERVAFDAPKRMKTLAPSQLLWLDPRNGQVLEIGLLNGGFVATAGIVLTSDKREAYEVDYTINQDYGLTAISDALVLRMRDAGYTASVRAFVMASDNVIEAP